MESALLRYRSISIIGMCKNAGKTTVLNRMIALLRDMPVTPALTSIGRDGEATDVVTGTEKPGIWIHAGTLFATATDMLRFCDVTREVLATTGMRTPLGEVVVARALSDGFVQLAGPSMNGQLAALKDVLRSLGADIVLIDGAISRKTLAAPAVSEAAVLCAGASYHPDMEITVRDTAYAAALLTLPAASAAHPRLRVFDGALTDGALRRLKPLPGEEIAVEDGSRVLLTRGAFERLCAEGVRITARRPVTLCCVCVNPFSAVGAGYDARAFQARMAAAVSVPVLDVKGDANAFDGL